MKILQINCVYPDGSTGKLTQALHRELKNRGIDSLVVYGRGSQSGESDAVKLCPEWYAKANNLFSRFRGTMYGGCLLATLRLFHLIRREKPNVVHLQCINGYFVNIYRLVSWLKRQQIPTVVTLHAEFWYTGGCAHALACERWRTGCGSCPRWRQETGSLFRDGTARSFRQMAQAFRGFGEKLRVVSVSNWLRSRAEQSPVLQDLKHCVIGNGVDTDIFFCRPMQKSARKLVFHATAMFSDREGHLKGGWAVLELARRMPDADFLVAGKYQIKEQLPPNVILLGQITDQRRLADCYNRADVTLVSSMRETFSMVCAESLCCGTPVVGFCAGGPEEISLAQYSEFVPYGDLDGLENALRSWLQQDWDRHRISREAAQRYSLLRMVQEYERIYRGMTDETTA